MAVEDLRPIDEIGQDDRGDFAVVVDQVPLRVAVLWPENLGQVGQVKGICSRESSLHVVRIQQRSATILCFPPVHKNLIG